MRRGAAWRKMEVAFSDLEATLYEISDEISNEDLDEVLDMAQGRLKDEVNSFIDRVRKTINHNRGE